MPNRSSGKMISRSRRLRRDATDAERRLWYALRALKPLGYHFRRQAPFDSYILDFVEHSRKLVIEVDGSQHALPENRLHDAQRDEVLRRRGYKVLRVWNNDVRENIAGVIDMVLHLTPTRTASRAGWG